MLFRLPAFLLALILMWGAFYYLGADVGGLFSREFLSAPWSLAKFVDLLKHAWVAILVLSVGRVASLIRTMRANMLDELSKPYVDTARAKGLRERDVIRKYPVRVAINPILSTIGWQLPVVISGSVIVASVLGLPTTAHILGGAPIGRDAEEGVVNENFELHNYPGLYIIDGSVVPANPGVNPSLTITALAEYAMSKIESKKVHK